MYCIFWPLIHKFYIFKKKQYLWANCPLGELSADELSVGRIVRGLIVRGRIVRGQIVLQPFYEPQFFIYIDILNFDKLDYITL